MQKVLRQIAIRGGLTALFLAALGFLLTEIAVTTFFAPVTTRTSNDQVVTATAANESMLQEMRATMPLSMAIWGFAIVATLELLKHFVTRGRTPAPATTPPPPDATENLLEELLTQAESRTASSRGAVDGKPVQPSNAK
jgi:hypothetical protein